MTFAPQREEGIGTIDSLISRSIIRRVYNDGDRTYLTLRQEARNSLPITQESTAIIMPLTNPNIDLAQFDRSFISMTLTVRYALSGYGKKNKEGRGEIVDVTMDEQDSSDPADDEHTPKYIPIFVGFKKSSDCIGEYAI